MRIAYLTSQYPATSHTFIRREVEALRAAGISIETFSIRRPAESERRAAKDRQAFDETFYILPPRLAQIGLAHFRAAFGSPIAYLTTFRLALRHRAPGLRAFFWALFHFVESIALARELRLRGIEHLHNHFANAAANVGFLASRFAGLPWSLTLHGISETDYPAGLLLAEKIKASCFVACVSWFGRAQAMRIVPQDQWHKFLTVRCGLSLANLPARFRGAEVLQERRIVCVGRLSSEKGHFGLLEAFSGLLQDINARLVLVGDGPEGDELKLRSEVLGIADAVDFVGRKDEKDALVEIAQADLLVLPSFMEGLPVVLMEAMAIGTPVVATRVAGIPELIEHEKQGLLFRPADWADLQAAMTRILSDTSLAKLCAASARLKIEEEFEIAIAVEPLAARFRGT